MIKFNNKAIYKKVIGKGSHGKVVLMEKKDTRIIFNEPKYIIFAFKRKILCCQNSEKI